MGATPKLGLAVRAAPISCMTRKDTPKHSLSVVPEAHLLAPELLYP